MQLLPFTLAKYIKVRVLFTNRGKRFSAKPFITVYKLLLAVIISENAVMPLGICFNLSRGKGVNHKSLTFCIFIKIAGRKRLKLFGIIGNNRKRLPRKIKSA